MSKLSLILLRMSQSDVKKEKKKKSKMKLDDGEGSPLRSANAIELLEGGSNQPSEPQTHEITASQPSSHDSGLTTPVKLKGQQPGTDPADETSTEVIQRSRSASKESAREGSFEMVQKSRSASKDSVPGTPIETSSKGRRESGHSLTKAKNESGGVKGSLTDKAKTKPGETSNKKKASGSNVLKKSESSNEANKDTGNLTKKGSRILSKTKSISKSNVRETEDKKDVLSNSDETEAGKVASKDLESKENYKTNSPESGLANIIELSSIEEEQPRKLKETDETTTDKSDADTTTAESATNKSEQPKKEDPLSNDNKKEIDKKDNAQPASESKLCYSQDQSALETLNTIKEILVKLETTIAGNNSRRSMCSNVEVQTQDTERSEMVAVAGSAKDSQQEDKSFKCDLEKATKGFHFVNTSEQTGAYDKHCKMKLMLSDNTGDSFCKDLLEAGSQAPELNRCPCPCNLQRGGPVCPSRADDPNYYGLPYGEDVFTDRSSVGNCPPSDPYADICQKGTASVVSESISESQFTAECCQKCCLTCMDSENMNDPELADCCQLCCTAIIGSENITDDQFDELCQRYLNQVSENINDPNFIERCKKCNIPTNDGEQFRGSTFTETSPKTNIRSNSGENFRSNNFTDACLKCSMASNGGENFRSNNFTEPCPKGNIASNDRDNFRSNNFMETLSKSNIQGNGRENFRSSTFVEACQKCSIANAGSENIRGNNFSEPPGKKPSIPSKSSSNVRGTSFTEPCKKCSVANSGASSSRANSFSEPCKKCGRNRMSTDQNNEMKYVENDFFNDPYPERDGGFSFSGKGSMRDTRASIMSKNRNVRFNESVDEKHVSNIQLSQANGVPYGSLDDSAVTNLAGSSSYYTGRPSMQMPAHHRRGTPYPGSSQTRLSPIDDESFVPMEFTATGSYYSEPEVPNANYGYDSGAKRGGQNVSETPQLQVRQYEKSKNPEGKNISYSNCELDNIYLHAKGEMEDVKIFAAGQVKNIRIYAEGQLSNIMMFANGDVDNVEAFTEGDLQSMLTYDDGKEKLEFELIENNIDTLTMQDAFTRNIFKNKATPTASKCLKCQDCFNKGSDHMDICTKSVMPKFNQTSSACWLNAENKFMNVELSGNNTKSRSEEERRDGHMSTWDTNTDILTFDFNGSDYLGKNCSYNSDDSTDVSLASNGNMNKSVNTQMSYANTIKLLRNRSSVRAFGTSLQDSQPQTLTAVYTVGVWKPEDVNQSEGQPLPVNNPREENSRGAIGPNVSQTRGHRSKVKFRLGSDNILISNESVTEGIDENPDFTSVASTPGLSENVSRFSTPSLANFESNQQFVGDSGSINFNVESKISVIKDNTSRDCIDCNDNPKEEHAESVPEYQYNQIDQSQNVVPFLESQRHPSENSMQPLLENKFDFFARNVQSLLQSRLYQLQFGLQTLLENKIDVINYDLNELINHNYDVMYQIDKVPNGPEFLTGDRGDLLVVALDEVERNAFNSGQVVVEANTPTAEDKAVQTPIYAESYGGQDIRSLDEHGLAQSETSQKTTGNDMNDKSVNQILSVSSSPKGRIETIDSSFQPNNEASPPDNKQNGATQTNALSKSTLSTNNVWLVKNWPSGASRLSGLLTKCEILQCRNCSNDIWDHNNQKLNDLNEYNPSENSETTSESYYCDQLHQNWSDETSTSHIVNKTKRDFPTKLKVDQVFPMLQNELAQREARIDNLRTPDDPVLVMSQDYKSNSFYGRKKMFYPSLAEGIDNNDNTKIQNSFLIDKERKLNPGSDPNLLSQNYECTLGKNMSLKASDGVIDNYTVDYAKSETSSKPVIYLGIKAKYHVHPRCRTSALEESNNSKGDDDPTVYNQPTSSSGPSLQRTPLQERVCDCFYNCAINRSAFQSGSQNSAPQNSAPNYEEYNSRTQQMVASSYCPMHCCPSDVVTSEQQMFQNRQSETNQNVLTPRMSLNQLQPRKFIMEGRLFISSSLGNIRPDIFQPIGSPAQLSITQAPDTITDDDCGASYAPNVGSYQDSSRHVIETEPYHDQVEAPQKPTQTNSPYMDSKQYKRRQSSKSDKKLFFQACLINKRCQMNRKEPGLMNAKKSQQSNDQYDTVFRNTVDGVGTGNVRQSNIADTEVVNYGSKDFQSSPIATCTYKDFCGDVATDFCDCLANTQATKQCNDAYTDVDDLVCPSGSGKNDVSPSVTNSSVEISSGTKGSERPEYSARTSSSSASKRQRRPKRKESSSPSISFKVKVGISASQDGLGKVDTGRCIEEDSLAYGGRGPPGSKSRVSIVDTDEDNSRKKYHRLASSSDDVCTDDVTTPSDFSADEDRSTRNKSSRSFVYKCSAKKKPRRPSPNSKNVASRRYSKKPDYYESQKDVACECSYSDISPDRENLKRSTQYSPSHSQSQKFKRIERRICSKRADSDSNLDSEPQEQHCKRCSSPDTDKGRYVDDIGFVRERPGSNRGHKEMLDSKQRSKKSCDYEYETDDDDYSTREERGYQKYYYQNRASSSKTCPGRQCQFPPWSEKSANASSTIPQRRTPTLDRYYGTESKSVLTESFPVKGSKAKECGTPHKRPRTAATNQRASISTDEEFSDVAGASGRCPQGCMNQNTAIYNLNNLPRWSPNTESCAPRSNVDTEGQNMYERIGTYSKERWDDASQSALYNNGGESKVKRRLPRGFFMYGVDESEE